ncbi:uncharacterized protein LOC127863624 [Dreissena polymorpha]|nr:uncharacterized protein LOC127863624 [Dreissena polymorpha]
MICPVQCQGDDACHGSQKCCQYGCMITCLDPVSYDGPTTRFLGPCIVRLAEWEAANRFERPLYAANGDFMGTQYQGSQAICVTPDGTEISCFAVNRWEAVDMDYQCAGDQYAFKQTINVGQRFYCDRF